MPLKPKATTAATSHNICMVVKMSHFLIDFITDAEGLIPLWDITFILVFVLYMFMSHVHIYIYIYLYLFSIYVTRSHRYIYIYCGTVEEG